MFRVDCAGAGAADLGSKKENTAAEAVLIVISEVRGILIIRGHRQDKRWCGELRASTLRQKKKKGSRECPEGVQRVEPEGDYWGSGEQDAV